MIDDSGLFHGTYDPVKAREYYLRTRVLKGRKPGNRAERAAREQARRHNSNKTLVTTGKANRANTKSRREELKAQKAALEKRLERLQAVLRKLVEDAKKRSGGDPNKKKPEAKGRSSDSGGGSKADRNRDSKSRKPLTAKQKSDKARKAKEAYEKEHPNTLSDDVEILREQVKDIQNKIQKALKDAQARRNKAGKKDQKSGPNFQNSGPQGR